VGWLKQGNLAGLDLRASYYLLHLKKKPLSQHARTFLKMLLKTVQLTNSAQFFTTLES
jgi:hypothetical protein